MSIRWRLIIQCGILFSVSLTLALLLSYAFHTRGHYDDLDRFLVITAEHTADEATNSAQTTPLLTRAGESGGIEIALRLYTSEGLVQESSLGTDTEPLVDPKKILQRPSMPAFDVVAGLIPPLTPLPDSSKGVLNILSQDKLRWRVFVLPFRSGYIVALTPLDRLDSSVRTLRGVLSLLWLVGMITTLLGLWLVTSRALIPVTHMIHTASTITSSQNFSQRVDTPSQRDELFELARTFNQMMSSLESAYRIQQRFVADASHEMRAPLTVIQGNLELINRQHDMSESEKREALSETKREAERLARLVGDLLTLARADAGLSIKWQPVDLDSVVLDTFQAARKLSRGQELSLNPFAPATVEGDEDRLRQLLLILVDNALKYTSPDGKVILGLRCDEDTAIITVQDNGQGLASDDAPHVFERFFRADPARSRNPGGTGLGLSIAQWIVEQHKGAIHLQSELSKGTSITIRLPLRA